LTDRLFGLAKLRNQYLAETWLVVHGSSSTSQ
jgi:hypothetical protein